jgi:hypothetical protein
MTIARDQGAAGLEPPVDLLGNPLGVPWYSTTFGRDGILTAMQYLWVEQRGLLGACLGIRFEPDVPRIVLRRPRLPDYIRWLRIGPLSIRHQSVEFAASPLRARRRHRRVASAWRPRDQRDRLSHPCRGSRREPPREAAA